MKKRTASVILVLAVACTSTGHVPLSTEDAVPRSTPPVVASREKPDCAQVTGPRYGVHINRTSGVPGDTIDVFGTTLRTEGGRFAPSKRIEIWWNTLLPRSMMPDTKPKIDGSPIRLLGVVWDTRRCHFRTTFTVPDVPRGGYPIRTFVFHRGGYGWFGQWTFTVV